MENMAIKTQIEDALKRKKALEEERGKNMDEIMTLKQKLVKEIHSEEAKENIDKHNKKMQARERRVAPKPAPVAQPVSGPFDDIEKQLLKSQWLRGSQPTAADRDAI